MARLSIWEQTAPHTPFPTLHGSLAVDVCIVGGGITGITAAYLLKQAGKRVAVVDRKTVGGGDTGQTTAHLTALLDHSYTDIVRRFDKSTAKQAWAGAMEAIETIERIALNEAIACDFRRVDALKFAPLSAQTKDLHEEEETLRSLGVITQPGGDIPMRNADAFRVSDQGKMHPLKYLMGLARRIHGDGSLILEHTPVVGFDGRSAEMPNGRITAERFLFTTHTPIEQMVRSHLKLTASQTYVIAIPRVNEFEEDLFYDNLDPYHYLRNHGPYLTIGGADHLTGARKDTETAFADLERYVRTHITAEPRILARWSGEIFDSADGLPYVGEGSQGELFATGFSGTGITYGTLSGVMLRDHALGNANPYAKIFSPSRLAGWQEMLTHNLTVAWHFAQDRLQVADAEAIDRLVPGDGVVVHLGTKAVAVSKHLDGSVTAVSAVCTHLGCLVNWNRAEQSWDCPCHGSRYRADGEVQAGPAPKALAPVDLDAEHRPGVGLKDEHRAP